MPAEQAGQGTQTEQIASTPSTPEATKDKQTTHVEDDLMNALGIPKDVQAQISKADRVKEQGAHAASETPKAGDTPAATEEASPEPRSPIPATTEPTEPESPTPATAEAEADDEEEEPESTTPATEGEPPKVDKRQKRINRLTRQKSQLEDENAQLRGRLEKAEGERKASDTDAIRVPSATGRLAHITDERKLNQEVGRSEAVIDWCDAHTDGEGLTEAQIAPEYKKAYSEGRLTLGEASAKTVAGWRSEAEKVLLSAPNRRDELRTYNQSRSFYDNIAKQAWPELQDKSSAEYQLKQAILKDYPMVKGMAEEDYVVGLLIEGMKSVKGRVEKAQGPNGEKSRRDISPRAFEPRVPIAPTTPEPPVRDVREANAVSSKQKVNEAMSALVKDSDGSSQSLAAVLAAEEEAAGGTSGRARAPVKV